MDPEDLKSKEQEDFYDDGYMIPDEVEEVIEYEDGRKEYIPKD